MVLAGGAGTVRSAAEGGIVKVHYDAEAYHGRVRTACGASAQRTREHAKVTCAQCLCTKAFKSGPRTKAHRMGYRCGEEAHLLADPDPCEHKYTSVNTHSDIKPENAADPTPCVTLRQLAAQLHSAGLAGDWKAVADVRVALLQMEEK